MSFTEKYRPGSLNEIEGQESAVNQISRLVKERRPILIYGPTGTGKTAAAIALANGLGFDVIEVNASDTRNKDAIKEIVGNAAKQQSLFSSGKLILVDELDGIEGREDRGGLTELASILDEKQKHPIIFIANDPWDSKFSTLRKKCTMVEFHHLNYLSITSILKKIAHRENIDAEVETLQDIARRSAGDARAAINDMESLSMGKKGIKKEDIEIIGTREKEESIFQALRLVFKSKDPNEVLGAFNQVDMDMDEIIFWLDENMPLEYRGEDLAKGYEALSKADVFKGRIRRWQYWRFLVYISNLITAGVALAKKEKSPGFVGYKRTSRILKMWMAKQKNQKRKAIAEKIGKNIHCSKNKTVRDVLPFVKEIYKNKVKLDFELDEDEIEWLRNK